MINCNKIGKRGCIWHFLCLNQQKLPFVICQLSIIYYLCHTET